MVHDLAVKLRLPLQNKSTWLVVLCTLFVSLFITSVGLFLYNDYRKHFDNQLNQPHIELLQINLDVTNRAFRKYDEEAVRLTFHPAVLQYVQASMGDKQAPGGEIAAYLKALPPRDELHSVYLVDTAGQRMYSTQTEKDEAWSLTQDQSWIPSMEEVKSKPFLIVRRTYGLPSPPIAGTTELLSIIRPIVTSSGMVGAVIVNLDYDRFFTSIYTQLKNPQYILTLDEKLIYPKLDGFIKPDDMHRAVETIGIRPFGEVELDGQMFLANQAFSDVTGWRWISLVPLDDALKNARLVRNIVIMLSLLSILIGCAAIYYYSYTAFRPLKRIRQFIIGNDAAAGGTDLHELEHYIRNLTKEFQEKATVAKLSLPELRSKYIQDVLLRRIGAKEARSKWASYFQDWTDASLQVAIVSINEYDQWAEPYNEEDRLLLKYALSNLARELLDPHWRAIDISLDKEELLLILQSKDNGPQAAQAGLSDLDRIIQMAGTYLQMRLTISLGQGCAAVEELHRSFAEAKLALTYRLYEGYDRLIEYSQQMQPLETMEVAEQLERWNTEFIAAIDSADAERCADVVEGWAAALHASRPAPEWVYTAAHRVLDTAIAHLLQQHFVLPEALVNYTEHRLRMMNLDRILQLLRTAVTAMQEAARFKKSRKEHAFVQGIIEYMEEHLHENIGLQHIADKMQLSTSSVSSTFKQETGFSTYEYLTKLRIEKACTLLIHTDLRVADIAVQVGYQNENGFIRSFRKLMNITPGKYREMNRMS